METNCNSLIKPILYQFQFVILDESLRNTEVLLGRWKPNLTKIGPTILITQRSAKILNLLSRPRAPSLEYKKHDVIALRRTHVP